jgi:hypothetical protein
LVGDYLSMPVGRGGFHTIGLFMDVYSQKIFGFKYTSHGTTATTIASLNCICQLYCMPEVFMADRGSHFAGHAVRDWCDEHASHYHQVSAYSPWVNNLLEGTNGKLLSHLKCLCAPNLGEDEWAKITKFEDLPANWLTHFDTAIEQLNARILPTYKFSPDELCLGIVVNTVTTPIEISNSELEEASIVIQNNYVGQQHLAHTHILLSTQTNGKSPSTNKFKLRKMASLSIKRGISYKSEILSWTSLLLLSLNSCLIGAPHRVVDCIRNAYRLQMIQGLPVVGMVSARRLRQFIPREGTALAREQLELESKHIGALDEVMEGLDFEEDQVDQEEGVVEDVVLGEGEEVDGDIFFLCCDGSVGTALQGRGVHGPVTLVTE